MDRSQVPPLKSLTISAQPLAPHALAWSCDGELAVATDSSVSIFIPDYPKALKDGEVPGDKDVGASHQFSVSVTATGIFKPVQSVNAQLCACAGVTLPPMESNESEAASVIEGREVTSKGGTMSQAVRVEWSPGGMGANLRPVLTAMVSAGNLVTIGESETHDSITASTRNRDIKRWRVLWGLGRGLPLPSEDVAAAYRIMDERITSFSWAKEMAEGQCLLAYATDEHEVAIMSVQYFPKRPDQPSEGKKDDYMWEIAEVARFHSKGPHLDLDVTDPDYVPHGSAFSLQWSPWSFTDGNSTAMISYVTHNYVGFRRVNIVGTWERGQRPEIQLDGVDWNGLCLHLSANAFVEWENKVWVDGSSRSSRGVICTPFDVKPFEVPFNGDSGPPKENHSVSDCGTTYAERFITNPIAGLTIHLPDPLSKSLLPSYSFVRASATASNQDWYQTNVPDTGQPLPQWAHKLRAATTTVVTRAKAIEGLVSDSDSDDAEEEEPVEEEGLKVSPIRYRLWGLATSPGDGPTAVLVSKANTHFGQRRPAAKLMFGWRARPDDSPIPTKQASISLSTEAHAFEWMYGDGEEVTGVTAAQVGPQEQYLRPLFHQVISQQQCAFCDDAALINSGKEAKCSNGHIFSTCTMSGLAILDPATSRVCGVCSLRCIKSQELRRAAASVNAELPELSKLCGSCGGKFLS